MSNWQDWIRDPQIADLMREQENADVAKLALLWNKRSDLPLQWMLQQIAGRQIAKNKLPDWHAVRTIVYPDRTALEQCSSTITAAGKQDFVKGKRVADLTGGLGVDSLAFARVAEEVLYCEPDPLRFELAQHNFRELGLRNVTCLNSIAENTEEALKNFKADVIYLDPSRRDTGKRFFKLEDLQPDILQLLPSLLKLSNKVLLKAAPMFDIKLGIRQLERVERVRVVSLKNECKELLFFIDQQINADPTVECIEYHHDQEFDYSFRYSEEENEHLLTASIGEYILDPYTCVTKAGCFKMLTKDFDAALLHANTHLYTSASRQKGFPARTFKVEEVFPYDIGLIRESIKDKKAHLLFRNFPVKPEDVNKKLKFTSGGNCYLFFVTDHAGKLRVIKTFSDN
jgi:hypothetical protein